MLTNLIGPDELIEVINKHQLTNLNNKQQYLLTEKAYHLIQKDKMKNISKKILVKQLDLEFKKPNFNLYRFVESFLQKNNVTV